ncbi:hypothetical protein, partial [Natronospirillum operosum]|uniref:hypothetical protein n=1 Tax=Natronospirillum operosum TaxID=2759953 RepID=UPI00197BBEAA
MGPGWHWNYDSRLIWGTAVLLDEQLDLVNDTIAHLTSVIDDIESRKEYYEGHLSHSRAVVRDAAQEGIDTLDSYIDQLTPDLAEAEDERAALLAERQQRDEHRDRNQHTVDPGNRAEEEIGNENLKWVSPTGDRIIFTEDGSGYTPLGVNSYRLGEWSEGLTIEGAEGAYYHYNEAGLLVEQGDGQGGTITVERNSDQRITTIHDNQGRVFQVSYTGSRVREVTDPAGRKLTYQYDSQGRLVSVNGFDGRIESYAYDYAGNDLAITHLTDGEGDAHEYVYREQDGKTVVDRQIDADGHQWRYDYDFDNRTTVVHQRSSPTDGSRKEYHYGTDNLTRERLHYPSGDQLRYAYDDRGNRTRIIDELGGTTELTYDERGNVTHQTDPEGRTTTFERDSAGRLIAVTDPAGHTTRYLRDSQGQVTEIQLPTGERIRQSWQDGLLQHRID